MPGISLKHLIIGLLMLAAAGLAYALTPRERVADQGPKINLETMIPKQFGQWKLDETVLPLITDPKQQALINKIYNQTLSRTYMNEQGERIMLSIAYGGDQSDDMAVHKPEVCYPAQGFQLLKNTRGNLQTSGGPIPVKRLVATHGPRIEPITYWITLGDEVPDGGLKWKLAQLKYGLTGKIPDGLLFRVSSIQPDDHAAYDLQGRFVNDLLQAIPKEHRTRLAGMAQQ
ncbi:MAG: EpsI family protein [Hydrogenophilaceae bacterium]|nr:EpsI family protein [Hydrogenophilaceae bacterium]